MATTFLGIYEFLPNNELMSLLGQAACRDEAWFQVLCSNVLFLIGGFNSAQMNSVNKKSKIFSAINPTDENISFQTMLPVIMGHTPGNNLTTNENVQKETQRNENL